MRNIPLNVTRIGANEYSAIALQNSALCESPFPFNRGISLGQLLRFVEPVLITGYQQLQDIFHPLDSQIRMIWAPGRSSISEAIAERDCSCYSPDLYKELFDHSSHLRNRLVVDFNRSNGNPLSKTRQRDQCVFYGLGDTMILGRLTVAERPHSYCFNIPAAQEGNRKIFAIQDLKGFIPQ